MNIDFWKTSRGDAVVVDEINKLQDLKLKKKIYRRLQFLMEEISINNCLKSHYFDSIKGSNPQLYELIVDGFRIMFCIKQNVCWLLTLFKKKEQKTRPQEIKKAEQRAKEIFNSN